jgi:hypothetical protein
MFKLYKKASHRLSVRAARIATGTARQPGLTVYWCQTGSGRRTRRGAAEGLPAGRCTCRSTKLPGLLPVHSHAQVVGTIPGQPQ